MLRECGCRGTNENCPTCYGMGCFDPTPTPPQQPFNFKKPKFRSGRSIPSKKGTTKRSGQEQAPRAASKPIYKAPPDSPPPLTGDTCPACGARCSGLANHVRAKHLEWSLALGLEHHLLKKRPTKAPADSRKHQSQATAGPKKRGHTRPAVPPTKAIAEAPHPLAREANLREQTEREDLRDAKRHWGHSFREGDGSYGSYPLHDSFDDDSTPH